MEPLTVVAGLGRADHCECVAHHRPTPARYVWHHVLPRTCGGPTTAANLVQLCDSAHYAIHVLLYELRLGGGVLPPGYGHRNSFHLDIARTGYERAVVAGTVDRIPKEAE